MSIYAAPPEDLCVSNLLVSQTVNAPVITTLQADISSIPESYILPIFSVFSGKELGNLTKLGDVFIFTIINEINDSAGTLSSGTPFATINNWKYPSDLYFDSFFYNPGAATIDTAGSIGTVGLNTSGQIFALVEVSPNTLLYTTGQPL